MDLEKKIAEFYGAEESILYSDGITSCFECDCSNLFDEGIACISSVIPAFAKKGDVVLW